MVFAVIRACAPADSRRTGADLYGRWWGHEKIYTSALKRTLSRGKRKDVEWRKDDRYGRMGVKMVSAARIDGGKPAFQASGHLQQFGVLGNARSPDRDQLRGDSPLQLWPLRGPGNTLWCRPARGRPRKVIQNKIDLDFS
jgi:hypothetical protein